MYSWEIQELMQLRNYLLTVEEYLHICSTSPQIREVSYNAYENNFNIKTDDKYDWTFKVKSKGGK